ncbi:DUF4158 domain-containing protein [Streptomyces sp. NPDC054765]
MERTAYPRVKRLMSAREMHVFATPKPEEAAWARERTRFDEHLLALTLALKCFQKPGVHCVTRTPRRSTGRQGTWVGLYDEGPRGGTGRGGPCAGS